MKKLVLVLAVLFVACAAQEEADPAPFAVGSRGGRPATSESEVTTTADDGESPSAVPDLFEPDDEQGLEGLTPLDADLEGGESEET